MLTRLRIRNFKCIGDSGLDLALKPLTILIGPNGSGKSSVFEALGLLAQSVRNGAPGTTGFAWSVGASTGTPCARAAALHSRSTK